MNNGWRMITYADAIGYITENAALKRALAHAIEKADEWYDDAYGYEAMAPGLDAERELLKNEHKPQQLGDDLLANWEKRLLMLPDDTRKKLLDGSWDINHDCACGDGYIEDKP